MQTRFFVRAIWDDDARVYYSDTDIRGLVIEAPTIDEFEELVFELGPEMIMANHLTPEDVSVTPLRDLVPTIVFQRPLAAVS
jgi:hypothetical protein